MIESLLTSRAPEVREVLHLPVADFGILSDAGGPIDAPALCPHGGS